MTAPKAIKKYFELFKKTLDTIIKTPTSEKYEEWEEKNSDIFRDVEYADDDSKPSKESVKEILDYIQNKMLDLPKYPSFKCDGEDLHLITSVVRDVFTLFSRCGFFLILRIIMTRILKTKLLL